MMTPNRFARREVRDNFGALCLQVAHSCGARARRQPIGRRTTTVAITIGTAGVDVHIDGTGPDLPYMAHWYTREGQFSLGFSAAVGGKNLHPHHKETTIEEREDVFLARLRAGLRKLAAGAATLEG